jgi:ketosteroid isomerase-like protein
MAARGPHDEREQAERILREGVSRFNEQDADAAYELIAEDAEYVTRDGVFRGPQKFRDDFAEQMTHWRLETRIEEVIDAGDGALVLFTRIERLDQETGKVAWKAWPAMVARVNDGKIVFLEGYVDRRKALAELGVEQG